MDRRRIWVLASVGLLVWNLAAEALPSTTAAIRNLIESFIGVGTVTSVVLAAAGREADVHVRMDGVRAMPPDRKDWLWFFEGVSEIATSRVFQPPQAHAGLARVLRIRMWYSLRGRVVARAARDRGQAGPTVVLTPP
ncbi:hypothetical protein HRbin32_00201 [bacterium HR32]|nr:hypothetical protein HRbin32_00201 [bacterium HR32]